MIESFSSALSPMGPQAEVLADLTLVMTSLFGGVFAVVMFLVLLSLITRKKQESERRGIWENRFIVLGGVIVPTLILSGLLVYTLFLMRDLRPPREALTIEVTGHMWWWDVRYPEEGIVTANEIHIPVGKPVRIELASEDVIHSLWVPSLAGKVDLIPAVKNVHWLQASRPGKYWGQCAEFCGLQHARMRILVVALPESKFNEWVKSKQQLASFTREALAGPDGQAAMRRGLEVFNQVGCAECHAIKGTSANGKVGPDLTHVGSRLTLGAGTIPNNHGNMGGWVANPQALKPGNKMPATYIEPEPFHALIHFLMRLK